MAGKCNASFAVEVMSGLVSDVDTACIVLNHTSAVLFQRINNSDVESFFDSMWLEGQLDILLHCLGVLTRDKDYRMLDSCVGSGDFSIGQSISDICISLLDRLCCPVLDHVVASGISSDCSGRVVAGILFLAVSCFSFATCEARRKVFHKLIDLLHYKESSSFHLPLVKALSQLYECQDYAAAFAQSPTDELLTVIEELSLTANESFTGRILTQLVPSVLMHCDRGEVIIARLRSIVERCYSAASDGYISRCCFLICGLSDIFFTPRNDVSPSFSSDLLSRSTLWTCVQQGLQHSVSLTRKRAIFVLRRALDFAGMVTNTAESTVIGDSSDLLNSVECLSQLMLVWHEVIVLCETLEEKQVSFCVICHIRNLVVVRLSLNISCIFAYILHLVAWCCND